MKDLKKNIFKYLLDMLIVAFGVFLGLYVSEWNTNRKTEKNTRKALSYIIKELESNVESLSTSIDYHEKIKVNLHAFVKDIPKEEFMKPYFNNKAFHFTSIKGWTGVKLPKLETIAFESAKTNGIFQELDIELTQLISGAYKQILFSQDFGKSLFDKMIQMNSSTKMMDAVGMIELLTTDILNTEKVLAKELENILEKIAAHKTTK